MVRPLQPRQRRQRGSLELIPGKQGSTWWLRFNSDPERRSRRPRLYVGTLEQYPTKAEADRGAEAIRLEWNRRTDPNRKTLGDVIRRYQSEEMDYLAWATARSYSAMHKNYLLPRWGKTALEDVKAVDLRSWIRDVKAPSGAPLSGKTRGNLLGHLHSLFRFAMLWSWYESTTNPTALFTLPGRTFRSFRPNVITSEQFELLMGRISRQDIKLMICCGVCLGLSISETSGLKWKDIDTNNALIRIRRAVVEGRLGKTKNAYRDAPLPLAPALEQAFTAWRRQSQYAGDEDWVFASPNSSGKSTWNVKGLREDYLIPAGKEIGLGFNLGWHALRHSYKSLLEIAGTDLAVQKDLMRHADIRTTMQHYGSVHLDRLRAANAKVVALTMGLKST